MQVKKKGIKMTAAAMALVMLLTGCGSSEGDAAADRQSSSAAGDTNKVKIDKKALSVYQKAPITQVEDQQYSMGGYEGVYTGDWKGNRPEGQEICHGRIRLLHRRMA